MKRLYCILLMCLLTTACSTKHVASPELDARQPREHTISLRSTDKTFTVPDTFLDGSLVKRKHISSAIVRALKKSFKLDVRARTADDASVFRNIVITNPATDTYTISLNYQLHVNGKEIDTFIRAYNVSIVTQHNLFKRNYTINVHPETNVSELLPTHTEEYVDHRFRETIWPPSPKNDNRLIGNRVHTALYAVNKGRDLDIVHYTASVPVEDRKSTFLKKKAVLDYLYRSILYRGHLMEVTEDGILFKGAPLVKVERKGKKTYISWDAEITKLVGITKEQYSPATSCKKSILDAMERATRMLENISEANADATY